MSIKYMGQIVELRKMTNCTYITVNGQRVKDKHEYYIPCNFVKIKVADNLFKYTRNKKEILKFKYYDRIIDEIEHEFSKYREFEEIEIYKNICIFEEIWNIECPFEFTEFFDGFYIYLNFTNLKVEFNLKSNTFIEKIGSYSYKIPYTSTNIVNIYSDDFLVTHTPRYKMNFRFAITIIDTKIQVKIFLESIYDKYCKMKDTMKDSIIEMVDKMTVNNIPDNLDRETANKILKLYQVTENDIEPIFFTERLVIRDSVIVYNANSDFETLVYDKYLLLQKGNFIVFDNMCISLSATINT